MFMEDYKAVLGRKFQTSDRLAFFFFIAFKVSQRQ
jgi:hypothetical protein